MKTTFFVLISIATLIFLQGCGQVKGYLGTKIISDKRLIVNLLEASNDAKGKKKVLDVKRIHYGNDPEIMIINDSRDIDEVRKDNRIIAGIVSMEHDGDSFPNVCLTKDDSFEKLDGYCKGLEIRVLDCPEENFLNCLNNFTKKK